MNTMFRLLIRTAILTSALVVSPSPGFAHDSDDQPQRMVKLAGLDLTTTNGMLQARRNVNSAARSVCEDMIDVDGFQIMKWGCVYRARADGMAQLAVLQQRALAAGKLNNVQVAYSEAAVTVHASK